MFDMYKYGKVFIKNIPCGFKSYKRFSLTDDGQNRQNGTHTVYSSASLRGCAIIFWSTSGNCLTYLKISRIGLLTITGPLL